MKLLKMLLLCICGIQVCSAQPTIPSDTSLTHYWRQNPALFLESNRLLAIKNFADKTGWFQAGFGSPLIYLNNNPLGFEFSGWGRLSILPHAHFPLETIDFYLGAYYLLSTTPSDEWRVRIGHISSHYGDGKETLSPSQHFDTIFAAPTNYASEFCELMYQSQLNLKDHFLWSVGIRAYFHQIIKIDDWVSLPASVSWYPIAYNPSAWPFALFISSGAGPFWPNISGGLRCEKHFNQGGILDLQLGYYYGASWAGTETGLTVQQLRLQLGARLN